MRSFNRIEILTRRHGYVPWSECGWLRRVWFRVMWALAIPPSFRVTWVVVRGVPEEER